MHSLCIYGNIPTKYGLIWYCTSVLGTWMGHWNEDVIKSKVHLRGMFAAWWGGSSTSSHAGTYCNILLQSSWGDITDVVMEINTTPPWTFCWTQDRISGWFIRGGTWYHLELKHRCFRAHLIKQHVPGLELWYPGELWCYSLLFTWVQQGSYPAKDVAGSAISEKRRVQVSLCRVNWQNPQFLWLICIDMISMCVSSAFTHCFSLQAG